MNTIKSILGLLKALFAQALAIGINVLHVVGSVAVTIAKAVCSVLVAVFAFAVHLFHVAKRYINHLWRKLTSQGAHVKGLQSVSGKGCVIFPLDFAVTRAHAKFTHHSTPRPPSCNPHEDDWVTAEVVTTASGYGIKVCWQTLDTREIQWDASGFSY